MDAEFLVLFFLPNSVVEHVREKLFDSTSTFFAILNSLNFDSYFQEKKQFRRRLLDLSLRVCIQCKIRYCFSLPVYFSSHQFKDMV